jgi:hypothetical protein
MADYASASRSRWGGTYFDGTGKVIALDPRPRMTLELSEQFNTSTGVYVPKASTGVNTGAVPVTNGSVHIYRPSQVTLSGGNVVLSATKEGSQWYSGYLDTEGTYQVSSQFAIYTKFRLPYGFGPGAWPSGFGMFGTLHQNWPTNEELDGLPGEWVHTHPDRFYFTTHYDDPYGSGNAGHAAKPDYPHGAQNWVSGFDPSVWHETLVIARAGIGMEWYLDGDLKFVTNGYNNSPTPRFAQPFRMILNFAIGGNNGFPDNPDGSSNLGSGDSNKFLIDTVEVYRMRPAQTFFGGIQYPSVTQRADGGVVKLIKDDGSFLSPPSTGGGTGGGGTGGGTGGTGLPPAGTHALFSDTLSPTRVPIDWDSAVIDGTARISSAMIGNTGAPYVAVGDSGCAVYFPSATEVGRLRIIIPQGGFNPGDYTYPCPVGAQPSNAGTDDPMQLAQADGTWVDIFGIQNANIVWSGNNGTATGNGNGGSGITIKNWKTGTGWPSGTIGNVNKFGFVACGATVASGPITPEDKQLGYIAHALSILFNGSGLANGPWLPALREDSPQGSPYPSGNTFFHQGSLLALPPTGRGGVAVPTGFSTMEKMICEAFTNYGGYVMDRTGGFTIRATTVRQPGVTATLASSDFSGVMSMAAGSCGKFLFDNLRLLSSNAKPSLGAAHR